MRQVRQHYHDTDGDAVTISRFGDSITVSLAFFQPLAPPSQGGRTYVNVPPEAEGALQWIRTAVPNEAWHWQGSDADQHGAQGGVLSDWPLGPVPDNWPDQIGGGTQAQQTERPPRDSPLEDTPDRVSGVELNIQADRAGITVFRGSTPIQPARQVSVAFDHKGRLA
jgi:hypothetical protein